MPNSQQKALDFIAKMKRKESVLPLEIVLDNVETNTLSLLYDALSTANGQLVSSMMNVVKEMASRYRRT